MYEGIWAYAETDWNVGFHFNTTAIFPGMRIPIVFMKILRSWDRLTFMILARWHVESAPRSVHSSLKFLFHGGNFTAASGTAVCHNDNFRCRQFSGAFRLSMIGSSQVWSVRDVDQTWLEPIIDSLSVGESQRILVTVNHLFMFAAWPHAAHMACPLACIITWSQPSFLRLSDRRMKFTGWRHQMETFSVLLAFLRGIHRSPVNSPHKGQWRGALMFSFICAWINDWVNNREAGDLRRHRAQLWRHCNACIGERFTRFHQERCLLESLTLPCRA